VIPKEIIDEIFTTSRIEEVIGEFVQLKRSGSSLKGLSPFVKEKSPSFMVSPAKQIFKDFSSGKGGNVVSFLMEHEAMSYPEALRWLADKYKIEIPERQATPEEIAQRNERESFFLINGFSEKHLEKSMWEHPQGKAVGLSYFKERGFTEDTIRKFHLGYCLEDGKDLFNAATKAGYNPEHLVKLGLSKKNDKGYYDFFRGRVMFPIHNLTGRVVGFGGRTLRNDKKIAKYFNSPESEIYNKSSVLYGLYQSKSGIIREDVCLLVEGYTDVISLHQSGVDNVVSSSGTSLTEGQIRLIERYTRNITILYDGDAAGIKASFRGIDMILEQGLNVRIVLFPEGEDPDSFAKQHTRDEVQEFIKLNAKDFVSFKTEILLEEAQNDPIKKAALIKQIIYSIALIPDQITRSVYLRESSERFQMDEQDLAFELGKIRRDKFNETLKQQDRLPEPQAPIKPKQVSKTQTVDYHQEQEIIRLLLMYGNEKITLEWVDEDGTEQKQEQFVCAYMLDLILNDDLNLANGTFKDIFEIFLNEHTAGRIPTSDLFYRHHDPAISSIAVDLTSQKHVLSENWENSHRIYTKIEMENLLTNINNALNFFKLKKIKSLIHHYQEELKQTQVFEEQMQILARIKEYNDVKKHLAEHMGAAPII